MLGVNSEYARTPVMETYEDHPWCPSGYQSEEEEEEHHHDPHLAKVRARSNSHHRHHHRRSSFLVDELDMLMDKAATTIQATWRGYLTRKQLMSEHAAASTIQAAWRGFITREYLAMQQDQVPSWNVRGHRRRTPSPVSSEDGKRSWGYPSMEKEKAAEVIQAHYRGYMTRRAISQCHEAATTIQSHWRGYRTRQDLAEGQQPLDYGPYGHQRRVAGGPSGRGPHPRPHWKKVLVGEPEEWRAKVPNRPPEGRRRGERARPPKEKTCPQCGRCTTVRVLTGVGKGPPTESEADESDYEGNSCSSSASRSNSNRNGPSGPHVSYSTCPPNSGHCRPMACYSHRHGCGPTCPRGMCPHYSPRPTRDCYSASRSLSSTSVRYHRDPADGTADWLFENYCTRPIGEGQTRVFKTRKHMWEVVRAATLIQSFWRGWKARRALRLQQAAATRIQSAYRGYKTRAYLTEAGVLSEGDTD
ncbi:UNVERIFIED_CONTAM: hypothetical protein K2H54_003742 [Gekko kuhli]